jgi:hypothetical protein
MIIRTRPFWTGHPLEIVARFADLIPVLALPVAGFVLGAFAWYRIDSREFSQDRLRGKTVAIVAILVSVGWIGLFIALLIYVATIDFPVPG